MDKWDRKFMLLAKTIADDNDICYSRKVGCVVVNPETKHVISIGYNGPATIESFDPGFEELNRLCAIWRKFADTGEELAIKGLKNLKKIEVSIQ